jgi:CRP/FNR family transcriptional regulator
MFGVEQTPRACFISLSPVHPALTQVRAPLPILEGEESLACDPLVDLNAFAETAFLRQRLRRGDTLSYSGEQFSALYAIRTGFFKTARVNSSGQEQVMGFFMRGELVGLDGVGSARYDCTSSALEDSEVIVLPYASLQHMAQGNRVMQRQLHAVLSLEITRAYGVMMLLGSMTAEARLASFLVDLAARLLRRGHSPCDFVLRMTREEIGSYLGLKLETVSRTFSQFQKHGLLEVYQKRVRVLDIQGLRGLLSRS